VSSAIPLPATALLIAFFQVFFKVNRPEQVARNFAGDSMFFILGILLISNIMISQKIDRRLASLLINLTGYNLSRFSLAQSLQVSLDNIPPVHCFFQ
jgi:di/tricarboxylate transporter